MPAPTNSAQCFSKLLSKLDIRHSHDTLVIKYINDFDQIRFAHPSRAGPTETGSRIGGGHFPQPSYFKCPSGPSPRFKVYASGELLGR